MPKKPTKKEIDAYFKRVEDPTNYSSERWWYLIESWSEHCYKIMEEKRWVDDGSAYYGQLINTLHQVHEAPLHDFVSYWERESPEDAPHPDDIGEMVKTWTPCTNEVAMVMFEYVMDDFEEIWQEQEDKIIQQIKDDGAWMDDVIVEGYGFIDIKHPDNWKKLEIAFKESDITQMKYKYDGEETDWIDVSTYLMKKPSLKEPKHWVEVLTTLCEHETYALEFDSGKVHDIIYRPNILLKEWFLPNAATGVKYNPIYYLGKFTKQRIPYSKYASHIRFSYQP